ncbi:hypothetical protein HAX54_011857, partial [Datura stramonium]|nr:hypothetical protein [Datura stramonium]
HNQYEGYETQQSKDFWSKNQDASMSSSQDLVIANATGLYQKMNTGGAGACVFTKDQYDQLLQLLSRNKSSNSNHESAGANVVGTSDLQGMNTNEISVAFLVSNGSEEWIIDTGETNHM